MSKQKVLKQIEQMLNEDRELKLVSDLPFQIGQAYFIRTVTYFATGRVKEIVGQFLVLEEAAWIADTGRFSDAMSSGIMNEVEPVEGEMFINSNSIIDAFPFNHKLPRDQK